MLKEFYQMSMHNLMAPTGAALLKQLSPDLIAAEMRSRDLIASGKRPGPITGFSQLDAHINGFLPVGLHTLLAAPGAGKTAFALQIAAQCGFPALYVTAEMNRLALMRRVIARTTKTFTGKLSGGTFSSDELTKRINQAIQEVPMLSILDSTAEPTEPEKKDGIISYATPDRIIQAAQDLKTRFDAEHVLIVIDSISDWALSLAFATPNANATEYLAIEAGLTGIKGIYSALNCPVIGIAHKNRSSQSTSGEDALHSAKGNGRFEYFSETVWSLDPTPKEPDTPNEKPITLTLAKNRHGQKGAPIHFKFEGRLMEFRQIGSGITGGMFDG